MSKNYHIAVLPGDGIGPEVMAQALNAQTAEKAAQYAAHTERLEQRVRVLERIVTDRGIAVSDEIEALRDDRDEQARGLN